MAWTLPPLTPRMAEFVAAYLEIGTVKGACRTIGMAAPAGFRCMRDPRVQEAIRLGGVPEDAVAEHPETAAQRDQRNGAFAAGRQRANERKQHSAEERRRRAKRSAERAIVTYGDPLPPLPPEPLEQLKAIDATGVLNRLALIADANVLDLFKPVVCGRVTKIMMRRLDEIPRELAYAIARLELAQNGTIKVHLNPKLEAIRLLGQAVGAFARSEDEGKVGGEIAEEELTLESRLERYGNVTTLRPKPVDG